METLAAGTLQNTRTDFQTHFDQFLHICLRSPEATNLRQAAQDKLSLTIEGLKQAHQNVKNQISQLKQMIRQLSTRDKVRVISRFTNQMNETVKRFENIYAVTLKNFQSTAEGIQKRIAELKQRGMQKQMHTRKQIAQITPQDKQLNLLLYQCNYQSNQQMLAQRNKSLEEESPNDDSRDASK